MDMAQVVHTAVAAVADRIAAGSTTTDTPIDQLHRRITDKLNTSVIGAHLLRQLERQPTAATTRRDATQAVAAEAEADHHFATDLRHLVDQLTHNLPPTYRPPHIPPTPDTSHTTPPPATPKPNTGTFILIAAVAAILLTISTTMLVKLALPHAGLTESARLARIVGTWAAEPPDPSGSLTIRPDGTFTVSDPDWSCPGRVTSPARSQYVLDMDCGLFRTSFDGELNLLGNKLTLTTPGSADRSTLVRQ